MQGCICILTRSPVNTTALTIIIRGIGILCSRTAHVLRSLGTPCQLQAQIFGILFRLISRTRLHASHSSSITRNIYYRFILQNLISIRFCKYETILILYLYYLLSFHLWIKVQSLSHPLNCVAQFFTAAVLAHYSNHKDIFDIKTFIKRS